MRHTHQYYEVLTTTKDTYTLQHDEGAKQACRLGSSEDTGREQLHKSANGTWEDRMPRRGQKADMPPAPTGERPKANQQVNSLEAAYLNQS